MAAAIPISVVRASSVDTQKRLPYNPHRTYPKKLDSLTAVSTANSITAQIKSITNISISDLLKRDVYKSCQEQSRGGGMLYTRRHFLLPPLDIEEFNNRVMAVVRCEAQDAMLQKLIGEDFLSQEERGVLRWGKNIASAKTRTKKRAGVAVYNRASSLETLVGYLYLTNVQRLEEIMQKLGFSSEASAMLPEEN